MAQVFWTNHRANLKRNKAAPEYCRHSIENCSDNIYNLQNPALLKCKRDAWNISPVFRKPISAKRGLNFNLGFYTSLFDSLFGIIFSTLYGASNHQIVDKKNYTEFSLKASRAEIRFHTNPGLSKPSFEQPSPAVYYSLRRSIQLYINFQLTTK